jgi:hypothetical protein
MVHCPACSPLRGAAGRSSRIIARLQAVQSRNCIGHIWPLFNCFLRRLDSYPLELKNYDLRLADSGGIYAN